MRTIIVIILIFIIVYGGYLALGFFGYYIEWKNPLLTAIISIPVVQSVLQFFQRPELNLFKRLKKPFTTTNTKNDINIKG